MISEQTREVLTATLPAVEGALDDITPHYDVILCDVWGVLHNGIDAFDGASRALADDRPRRPANTRPRGAASLQP